MLIRNIILNLRKGINNPSSFYFINEKAMVHKTIIGNELYVYLNGSLLYKRWLDQSKGVIIQSDTPMGRAQGSFKSNDVWQHVVNENK